MYSFGGYLQLKVTENNLAGRDSALGILTGCELDGRGCRISSPGRDKIFLLSALFRQDLGPTQPPIQWVPVAVSSGIGRLMCEADHFQPVPK
jgi:hypothetical protein